MRWLTGRGIPALFVLLVVAALAPAAALGAGGDAGAALPAGGRLAPDLAELEAAFQSGGPAAAADVAARQRLFVRGSIVEVEALTDGRDAAVAAAVRSTGGTVVAEVPGVVGAEMPLGRLRALSDSPGVAWVQSPAPVYEEAVNTSQAVALMDVDDWHAAGFRGQGVDVAVVDSGFKGRLEAKGNGDLPSPLQAKNFCDAGLDGGNGGTTHGTGVAEIVYDIAPAADLWLVCVDNSLDFAKAINWMAANGIDVFNASLGFIAAYPGDGTGTLKAYSTKAERAGITWVNSAGNYALNHWGGTFTDGNANGRHDFPGAEERFTVTVAANWYIQVFLRWDDTWDYAGNDFDLYLYEQGNPVPLAQATTLQGSTAWAPPKEQLFYNNGAVAKTLEIEVRRGAGDSTTFPQFDLFFLPTDQGVLTPVDPTVAAGSLNDASRVAKVLAVGAVWWDLSQTGGAFAVQGFSSQGPNYTGLKKPDVAGYDGVDTFSYPYAPPGQWGFFGTSAAAPHAAGVAVLLLQANPDFTPAQLRTAVKAHTRDILPKGTDNASGKGRLVLGAPPAMHTCNGKAATLLGSGDADEITGTNGPDVIITFGGSDVVDGGGGNDTICAGAGDDQVLGDTGADTIFGGAGNDYLSGGGSNDLLYGEAGDDTLEGGPGTDTTDGGDGTDACTTGENRVACDP